METSFTAGITPPAEQSAPAYWLIFNGYRLLVYDGERLARVPLVAYPEEALGLQLISRQYLGVLETEEGATHCYSAEVPEETAAPAGMAFLSLRQLFNRLRRNIFAVAGRAVQIVEWDRTHQYCGRCGSRTEDRGHERAKICPQCGLTSYPRLTPAVIVSVERPGKTGAELLLAHNHRHPSGFYSVLAGFVEPGETLEECVRREVREETGIEVKNIRYFGSQPWPFPNSLMIGFTAEYAGGEIALEEEELDDAGWYGPDELPLVPPPISIARQLIDAFVARSRGEAEGSSSPFR